MSHNYGYQFGLHVIDYYIHQAMLYRPRWLVYRFARDSDIETERREGWTYDHC